MTLSSTRHKEVIMRDWRLVLILGLASVACDQLPVQPTPRLTIPAVKANPAPATPTAFLGVWSGTSVVNSTAGLPDCRPAPWTAGGTEQLRVEIGAGTGVQYRMRLVEPVSGTSCELMGEEDGPTLDAIGGVDDLFWIDHDTCHRQLDTTAWPCTDSRPHVWRTDTRLRITFAEGDGHTATGSLSVGYDHSFGDPWFGPWTFGRLTKHVTLQRRSE
jgi:hypothetical protein